MVSEALPSIESLLERQDWVNSLARSLVKDPHRADDATQETWLAALRSAPTTGAGKAWLGTVLRNAVRFGHRTEERRSARERATSRSVAITDDDTLERLETQQAIIYSVRKLQEPYRRAIVARYFEERSIDELVEHLGVPRETVRTRLRRGRDLLRRQLESRGIGAPALLALSPAAMDGAIGGTSGASLVPPVTPLEPAGVSLMKSGGLLMSVKTTAIATVAAIGFASYSWVLGSRLDDAKELREETEVARLAASAEVDRLALELAEARARAEAVPVAAAPEVRPATVDVGMTTDEPAPSGFFDRSIPPPSFRSMDEVDRIAKDALEREDLETLWLLAAELIQQGEGGYEKLIEIAQDVDNPKRTELWESEELLAGPFLSTMTGHLDHVLDFALYLDREREEELPDLLQDFQKEMMHETGVALLGYYHGENVQLLDRFVEKYRDRLAEHGIEGDRYGEDMVRAVGQIRSDAAFGLLEELLDQAEGRNQDIVVRALAWQGHPRALDLLERVRAGGGEDGSREVLEAAIRYLKP
ncbi:MAG: sigma-70 family RNA polymerase sigma factor [Planctomycetota bacterium]